MKIKFWGVRGSIPAPVSPQAVRAKVKTALRLAAEQNVDLNNPNLLESFVNALPLEISSTIGANTTCITLEVDDHLIIFDAGSGLRILGGYLMTREFGKGQGKASIFFTHTHWDHIQGFPFFVPAFIPGNQFDIYHIHPHVPHVLKQQQISEVYPIDFPSLMQADLRFHQIQPNEVVTLAGDIKINSIPLNHPGQAYSYRVEDGEHCVVLATDGEYKQLGTTHTKQYIDFYQDADILIFDAQFSVRQSIIREDWGHSSALIGADMARAANTKQLLLFHYDPTSSDEEIMETLRQTREYVAQYDDNLLLKVDAAYEGWEIDLKRQGNFSIKEMYLDGVLCLSLSGDFDAEASEIFTQRILDIVQNGDSKKIVLDMINVEKLSIAGIHALLAARSNAYSLSIVNLPESIHRVIEMAETADFFAIYQSMQDVIDLSEDRTKKKNSVVDSQEVVKNSESP